MVHLVSTGAAFALTFTKVYLDEFLLNMKELRLGQSNCGNRVLGSGTRIMLFPDIPEYSSKGKR
jgi:hypothetical protein